MNADFAPSVHEQAPNATGMYDLPAVFSCSPRAGGNSDYAAECFSTGIRQAGGRYHVCYLRQFNVYPCLGCLRCAHDPHGYCFLADMDQSSPLFQFLFSAPLLFLSAPIYFYHLPAQFKTWIDRSQSYYLRREKGDHALLNLPRRPVVISLVAGRQKGEKLFDGAMLTLKYFLRTFNFEVKEHLVFKGVETPEDLQANQGATDSLIAAGAQAWTDLQARA